MVVQARASVPNGTIKSQRDPVEHGAEVGEEIEGVMSEGIEVSGGEERSLEEFLSRSTGAR